MSDWVIYITCHIRILLMPTRAPQKIPAKLVSHWTTKHQIVCGVLGQWRLSIKSNRTLSNTFASHRLHHLQRNQRYFSLHTAKTHNTCQLPTFEIQSSYDSNQIPQPSSTLQLSNNFTARPLSQSTKPLNTTYRQPWPPSKMALLQTKSNSQSNNCGGEVVARRAVVLASAYVVDRSAMLTGFHYSTTGADG